jgi:hypothetical protein
MNYTILVEFGGIIVLFAVGMIILACVIMILKTRVCKSTYDSNYYEPFESADDNTLTAIVKRINKIKKLKDELLKYSEDVTILGDETCMILKNVEEKYIMNSTQLKTEDDYKLPLDEQNRLITQRKTLAKKSFNEQKSIYGVVNNNIPLLECFTADFDQIEAAEALLNNQIEELEKIMDTAEVKAALSKKNKIAQTLNFTLRYLNDAVKSVSSVKKEGFYSPLTGAKLLARADELIGKAATLREDIKELQQLLEKENNMLKTLNSSIKKEEKGGNPAGREADMTRLSYAA